MADNGQEETRSSIARKENHKKCHKEILENKVRKAKVHLDQCSCRNNETGVVQLRRGHQALRSSS